MFFSLRQILEGEVARLTRNVPYIFFIYEIFQETFICFKFLIKYIYLYIYTLVTYVASKRLYLIY